MTAYAKARYDDYCQRIAKGETLSPVDQCKFELLDRVAYDEWKNKPQPFMYGGDYQDVF